MTIQAAITNLQAKALALTGVKAAPDKPPEGTGAFPFAVSYERSGTMVLRSANFADDLATIFTEVHVSRQILPVAINTAMALRDPFLVSIRDDPTLGGSISTVREVRRTFGRLEWGGIETIGYRFEIDIKVTVAS
jgi:hypothetical protein